MALQFAAEKLQNNRQLAVSFLSKPCSAAASVLVYGTYNYSLHEEDTT